MSFGITNTKAKASFNGSAFYETTTDATLNNGVYELALSYLTETPKINDFIAYVDSDLIKTLYKVTAVDSTKATLTKIGDIGGGEEIYSRNETLVGKWINGENLYQKVYAFGNVTLGLGDTTLNDTLPVDTQYIKYAEALFFRRTTLDVFTEGYHNTEKFGISLGGIDSQQVPQRLIKVSTDRNWNEAFDVFITIKYIKP